MLTDFQNLLLSDSGKFAISLVKISHQTYNISLHYLVKCECQKSCGSIVINDKSQGSRAKHLSYDGVLHLHYRLINQFAGERIFKICEQLAKLQAR